MESNTVLNPMAEFDFGLPIDVTIIFEEGDSETSRTNSLNEKYINIRHDKKTKESACKETIEKCNSQCFKVVKKSENLNKSSSLNKICAIQKKKTMYGNISKKSVGMIIVDYENALSDDGNNFETGNHINSGKRQVNHNDTVSNQHSLIMRGETRKETNSSAEGGTPSTYHHIDQHEQVTTFMEDLLNTLSENLILIMQLYYHSGMKSKYGPLATQDFHKRKEVLQLFLLSYNTMDSIILPQEQNKTFINKFLDNTVMMANSKSLKWKCQRCNVEPFFEELVKWSKQKRALTKAFNLQVSACENIILKRHLARLAVPLNLPHFDSGPNSDNVLTPHTHPNVCLFSSGTPGSEISINVSPETFINCTQGQYNNTVEWTGNQNYYPSCVQSATKKPPPYNSPHHDVTNNTKNHCYPQPYSMIPSSENLINNPNHNNQNIVHPIQNYQNIGQPLQNQQNIEPPIQHYRNEVQYVNTTQKYPCETALVKALHNNRKNIQMHSENSSRPVITNVTSFNTTACMRICGRCMCGKIIEIPCSSYNPACKPSYCSYLCRELNNQISKTTCGNT